MRPRGPGALLRNKEDPELERIPRARAAPAGLARACAPGFRPTLVSARAAADRSRRAGPGRRPGRDAQRGAFASPHAPSPVPHPSGPRPPNGCAPPAGPQWVPQSGPTPRARPSGGLGSRMLAGLRPPDTLRAALGRDGPGTPNPPPRPWRDPGDGAARPGGGRTERGLGPGEVTPKVPKSGGGASPERCPRPLGRTPRPTERGQPPPRRVLPPGRPRAGAAALTLHSGARGSCAPLPAPAAVPAPPGRARAAGHGGGGRRRSCPRAGASWRRPRVAGALRLAPPGRPSHPPSPRPGPAAPSSRPPSARRLRRGRAPLPPLRWLRSAAGGGGRSRAHVPARSLRPALAPPPPPAGRRDRPPRPSVRLRSTFPPPSRPPRRGRSLPSWVGPRSRRLRSPGGSWARNGQ
ncbi:proline-rich protein 2-like [Cynocephalus volans]|uniref:proline-rich protein 2-like n=1 Tax=Cynocephalus volans TaxID=110931 RepID=UPI002FCB567F